MRILVIDDDERLARAVQRSLTGHHVLIETDATRAIGRIEAAEADGERFDVVLCDFKMPGMSGLEVVGGLRARREPPMLILMSGSDDVVDSASDADRVLLKPFRTTEIVEAIDRLKAQRARTQTRRLRRIPREMTGIRRHGGA